MAVLVVGAALAFASAANAFTLRSPQVTFNTFQLQGYLSAWDGGINASTDQVDAQAFSTGITGNTDFTLLLKNATGTSVGVYTSTAASPVLRQIFPPGAANEWYAACHFRNTGELDVTLFDNNGVSQGSTTYPAGAVDRNNFGFYITGSCGTWYSQDYRNSNNPQVLTYAGTGANTGEWFECFQACPYDPYTYGEYTGSVVVLESVNPKPVPVAQKSWGSLKASYR
jgi:hypothetical protein